MLGLVLLVVSDLVLALIPAGVARGRGRPFGLWYALGAVALPVALVVSFVLKPTPEAARERAAVLGHPQCPACGEYSKDRAACSSCGAGLGASGPPPGLTAGEADAERRRLAALAGSGEISAPAYRRALYDLDRRLESDP